VIDVRTQRPFDFKEGKGLIAARGIYQEQADTFGPNISALLSDTWDLDNSGRFGALVSLSYDRTEWRDQALTAGAMVPFMTNGELTGFEVGVVYLPENLPGMLDGFGMQASFTSLDSEQNIPLTDSAGTVVGQDTGPFFSVSDTSYNVVLAYEKRSFSMRLGCVWREDLLARNEAALFANPLGVSAKNENSSVGIGGLNGACGVATTCVRGGGPAPPPRSKTSKARQTKPVHVHKSHHAIPRIALARRRSHPPLFRNRPCRFPRRRLDVRSGHRARRRHRDRTRGIRRPGRARKLDQRPGDQAELLALR
jgi:hypothetical protein